MATASNPLTGSSWGAPPTSGPWNFGPIQGVPNPAGYHDPIRTGELRQNMALENMRAAEFKNKLAPQVSHLMGQYGKGAGDFFQQLMSFGSPFDRQHQQEAFAQGVQQNQNAGAQAKR